MADTAAHKEENDRLGFRLKMRSDVSAFDLAVRRPHSAQGGAEESATGLGQEAAPVDFSARIDGTRIHGDHRM